MVKLTEMIFDFSTKFHPNGIIRKCPMSQKPVFVEPGRHFGPIINDGIPTTAYGKATERNCRLSIREIDMEITAVIVTTRVIKRHEFLTLYYGMEYWRMILHLYIIPDDIRAGIEYALAHD